MGLQQKEDALHRLLDVWAAGEAGASLGFETARATIDEKERLAHYADALRILHEDVPGVGMFQYHAIYAARRELQWQPTAGESFHVFDMKWQN